MTANHAPLAPSGAYQWAPEDGCLGAVGMQILYPEDADSEKSREGTAAHWVVTEPLQGRPAPFGAETPNGVPVNAEMIDCGQALMAEVIQTAAGLPIRVEQRVQALTIHPTDCWGTPDVYLLDRTNRSLYVWDYKYGHRHVDAYRNYQLIIYAIGILDSEGIPMSDWKYWSITMTIAQPRNYHPSGPMRPWTIGGTALLKYIEPLRVRAAAALRPNAPLKTGEHCRDCTARHACPALMQSAALSVDVAHEQTPMDLTPHAIGLELRYLSDAEARIKARKDALYEQALGLSRLGQDVPLWRADYSDGREVWDRPVAEVIALGEMFGADLRKPPEAITPVQARKQGIDDAVIRAYSKKPRGSLRLVPVTDDMVSRAFGE